MGIDAEMFVRRRGTPLDEDRVRELSVRLTTAFGAHHFLMFRPGEYESDPDGRHALDLVSEYHQDGDTLYPAPGEQFVQVHLWTRYYGIGYERGDLPLILAVARWARQAFSDLPGTEHAEVWYGGDSSGVAASLLDEAAERELWKHYTGSRGRAYYQYNLNRSGIKLRCDFCRIEMVCNGGGVSAEFHSCHGCGDSVVLNVDTGEVTRRQEKFGRLSVSDAAAREQLYALAAAHAVGEARVARAGLQDGKYLVDAAHEIQNFTDEQLAEACERASVALAERAIRPAEFRRRLYCSETPLPVASAPGKGSSKKSAGAR